MIDKYFSVQIEKHNLCDFVDIRNEGAYALRITVNDGKNNCGENNFHLAYNHWALVSVPKNAKIKLHAELGRTKEIEVPSQTEPLYRYYKDTSYRSLVPVVPKLICSGTTIIGFNCLID